MTITAFDIYLVSLADKIISPAGFIACLSLAITIFLFAIWFFSVSDTTSEAEQAKFVARITMAITIVCGSIAVFVPSSKTIAAMYVLPAIVNNEHIQNSTGNALEALENLTKEWLKDTVKSKDANHKEEHI